MDFYDLLKQASLNQKKAEKELGNNKRYNLKFAPMKKIERPKVNKEAIAAQLKKKEEEKKRKAELEEKRKQAVLTLRAEQEAAKSSKSRKDSSSTDLCSRKKEKVLEEKKKVDRRAKREDWYDNRKFEEKNADSSEDEGTFTQKSNKPKSEPELKQKPKALSFKELMALAASNRKGEKPVTETPAKENEKCENNVKLKSHTNKGEVRDRGEKHKVSDKLTKGISKGSEVQRSVEKGKSLHKINSASVSDQGKKPTLFPNCKNHTNSTTSSKKGSSSQSNPSTKYDRNSKSQATDLKKSHSGLHKSEVRKQDGRERKMLQGNQTSHHPPKLKGGQPEVVKETIAVTNKVGKASQKSHCPLKKKGGLLTPVEKHQTIQVEKANHKSHHPPKRKGGWLDPVEEPSATVAAQVRKEDQKSHHPPKRKGGWLDPVGKTSAVTNKVVNVGLKSNHPTKRKVDEHSVASGHMYKTSKVTSKLGKEYSERKGAVSAGRNGTNIRENGYLNSAQGIPSKEKVLHPKGKEKKLSSAPLSSASAKIKPPVQVKERKRGWLDQDPGQVPPLREERGGWLGPMRPTNDYGPSPAKRKGGWLGPIKESSFAAKRGRLLSSEDEEEDSDMDGFIDDTPLEEEGGDVSSYIKEIFGYDKSKYGYESDYALKNMEASYSQILKEEARSARIALQEDAEEQRKEKEREQQKLAARAKRK